MRQEEKIMALVNNGVPPRKTSDDKTGGVLGINPPFAVPDICVMLCLRMMPLPVWADVSDDSKTMSVIQSVSS